MNDWRYAGIEYDDIANGIGLGAVFFTQGCPHQCPECQNPQTWSKDGGKEFTNAVLDQLFQYYENIPYARRLTMSGGDPLANPELTYYIVSKFKELYPDKTVWLYTGYKIEHLDDKGVILATTTIINGKRFKCVDTVPFGDVIYKIIKMCDVVVDGQFEIDKRDITLQFMGSSNQRIIDVKETLKENQIVLWR